MNKIKWIGGRKITREDIEDVGGDWEKTCNAWKQMDFVFIYSAKTSQDGWGGCPLGNPVDEENYAKARFNSFLEQGYQDTTNIKEESPMESSEMTVAGLIKMLEKVDHNAKVTLGGEPFSIGYLSYDLIENTLDIGGA